MKSIKPVMVRKLENVLNDELENTIPPIILKDNTILYQKLKIVSSNDNWNLVNTIGDVRYSFNLKLSAMLAANYYSRSLFSKIKELELIDREYRYAITNISMFKYYISNSKDQDMTDIMHSRMDVAKTISHQLRKELKQRYIATFG